VHAILLTKYDIISYRLKTNLLIESGGGKRPCEATATGHYHQFQINDEIKAARIEATKAYSQYVEEPKTSQRRWRIYLELI
jgi:hypothetical protein